MFEREPFEETPDDRLLRAAIPGRPIHIGRRQTLTAAELWAPGRSSLQWSVVLSAFAILVPLLSAGALFFALRARRQGSPRWVAALVAAIWCCFLGVVLRVAIGAGIVP